MTADMSANRYKYFRWTPRTAWITFVYVAVVPSVLGYVGYVTEVSRAALSIPLSVPYWLWRGDGVIGKRKKERGREERAEKRCCFGCQVGLDERDADDVWLRIG